MTLSTKFKVGALALLLGLSFVSPELALAQAAATGSGTSNVDCTEWQQAQGSCEVTFRQIVLKLLNFFLMFLGLLATGFLIYGGFMYVTSAGDDANVGKAKKILTYAGLGILVILIASALVNTLLGSVVNYNTAA